MRPLTTWGEGCSRLVAALVVRLLVPLGVAIAVGAAVAHLVPPRWQAGGLDYVLRYPKNVELAAVPVGVAAGALSVGLAARRRLYALLVVVALGGAWLAATVVSAPASVGESGLLRLVLLFLAGALALLGWRPQACVAAAEPRRRRLVVLSALVALALFAAVSWIGWVVVDTFHQGGVLLAARCLLAGERPFRDFIPAHGLHDFGLAALWMVLLGKVGTSATALAAATNAGLGVVTLYLLARRAVASGLAALAGAAAVVALLLLSRAHGSVLDGLGMTVFVAGAYCLARPGARWRPLAAGAALAAAHVYRIDASLYALAALALSLAVRWLVWGADRWRARLAGLAGDGALVALGVALPLLLLRVAVGWPDESWLTHVLVTLRRYHPDADGLPMPWPTAFAAEPWTVALTAVTLAPILFALVLGAAAVDAVRGGWRAPRGAPDNGAREALVFLAAFAVLALRTTLTRSDVGHALMWAYLPLFGVAFLLLARPLTRCAAAPRATGWGLAGVAALLVGHLAMQGPERLRPLVEHLAPNPPLGPCADTMLTRGDAALAANRGLLEGTCALEQLLRAHGVERLLIDQSAPWYTTRFGQPPVSPFYALTKAYTPAAQRALIADVRAAPHSALLRARGYGALERFDVDNVFRIPVAEAYLRERRRGAPVIPTALGDLVLWDEPAAPAPPAPTTGGEARDVWLFVDVQTYDPESGFLLLEGWAADAVRRQPAERIVALFDGVEDDDLRRTRRPDAAEFLGAPQLAVGWTLAVHVPRARWPASVAVRASLADGRQHTVVTDPTRAVVLPGMSGPEWQGLAAAVDEAAALGRRDRAAWAGP